MHKLCDPRSHFDKSEGADYQIICSQKHTQERNALTAVSELELIPVVSEFPDVFPEELPGMQPVTQEVLSDAFLRVSGI